jgi:hypothetical protein
MALRGQRGLQGLTEFMAMMLIPLSFTISIDKFDQPFRYSMAHSSCHMLARHCVSLFTHSLGGASGKERSASLIQCKWQPWRLVEPTMQSQQSASFRESWQ